MPDQENLNVEIETLSDDDLDSVSGGADTVTRDGGVCTAAGGVCTGAGGTCKPE